MRLGPKLIIAAVLLPVFMIGVSIAVTFISGSRIIEERINTQLLSVATLKGNQLRTLIEAGIIDLENLADDDLVNFTAETNPAAEPVDRGVNPSPALKLQTAIQHDHLFQALYLTDRRGNIIYSTDETQIGKIRPNDDELLQGLKRSVIRGFYYDAASQKPKLSVSTAVSRPGGEIVGELTGDIDLNILNAIMTEVSGLGKTGETYLVNRFNYLVTGVRYESGYELKKTVYTDGVKSCLAGEIGSSYYLNYGGLPVLGYYLMVPEINACLLAEMNRSEALAPVDQLRNQMILLGLLLSLMAAALGYLFSKTITAPVFKLRGAAIAAGGGRLDMPIQIETRDEIGDLSSAFNKMLSDLKKSQDQIGRHTQELEQKVKDRTQELGAKLAELERMNGLMVGRELKMVELKQEIENLKKTVRSDGQNGKS